MDHSGNQTLPSVLFSFLHSLSCTASSLFLLPSFPSLGHPCLPSAIFPFLLLLFLCSSFLFPSSNVTPPSHLSSLPPFPSVSPFPSPYPAIAPPPPRSPPSPRGPWLTFGVPHLSFPGRPSPAAVQTSRLRIKLSSAYPLPFRPRALKWSGSGSTL